MTESDSEEKARFAEALIRLGDPFRAGLELFPMNTNRAVFVAIHWPRNPEVLGFLNAIGSQQDEPEAEKTPEEVKDELARFSLEIIKERLVGKVRKADGSHVMCEPPTDAEVNAYIRTIGAIAGFIKTPAPVVVEQNNNPAAPLPKAIETPFAPSLDDFEAASVRQQTELLNVSRTRH